MVTVCSFNFTSTWWSCKVPANMCSARGQYVYESRHSMTLNPIAYLALCKVILLWAGLGYIYMVIYSAFAPRCVSASSHVEAMGQQTARSDNPTGTLAGDHFCSSAVSKAATAWQSVQTLRCAVGPLWDCFVSQFFSPFFPIIGQTCKNKRTGSQAQCYLRPSRHGWTPCDSESFHHQYASVRSLTQKETSVEFMSPLLTLWSVSIFPFIHELSCLLLSGREILPGSTSVKDILLDWWDNRGL